MAENPIPPKLAAGESFPPHLQLHRCIARGCLLRPKPIDHPYLPPFWPFGLPIPRPWPPSYGGQATLLDSRGEPPSASAALDRPPCDCLNRSFRPSLHRNVSEPSLHKVPVARHPRTTRPGIPSPAGMVRRTMAARMKIRTSPNRS